MISHLAFLNYVVTSSRDYELGPGDHVLQFGSLSFDSSVEGIFPYLTTGAKLVLRTDWMLESASVFLNRCAEWGITCLARRQPTGTSWRLPCMQRLSGSRSRSGLSSWVVKEHLRTG